MWSIGLMKTEITVFMLWYLHLESDSVNGAETLQDDGWRDVLGLNDTVWFSSGCRIILQMLHHVIKHNKQQFYLTEYRSSWSNTKLTQTCENKAQVLKYQNSLLRARRGPKQMLCYWLLVGILIINKVTHWLRCCEGWTRWRRCSRLSDAVCVKPNETVVCLLLREWIYSFTESKLNVRSWDWLSVCSPEEKIFWLSFL